MSQSWGYVMGNMKMLLVFGFERWGGLRPAKGWINGRCFIPLAFGLWIRWPFDDYHFEA